MHWLAFARCNQYRRVCLRKRERGISRGIPVDRQSKSALSGPSSVYCGDAESYLISKYVV